jgi:hypothetical protein
MELQFVCQDCECTIVVFIDKQYENQYADKLCGVCKWLRDNTTLTDSERAELRQRLTSRGKT